jgi:hypothetical protein
MSASHPRLYDLLPAFVRFRDAYEGEPLRIVMEALELPFQVIAEDIDNLYRGWFIETCEEWMVPYLADLMGVRGLEKPSQMLPTQRTRIANALAYRRSKGTPAALERGARDATGWACRVVDYRRTLAATPALLEPSCGPRGCADLRRMGDLDALGGPFNVLSHTADFRPSDPESPPLGDRGGFHLRNLGLAFWRLQSYPVAGRTPHEAVAGAGYTFHPFGLDTPLFNPPQTAVPSVYASTERQVPAPLRREVLAEEIAALRRGEAAATRFFADDPVFRILVSGAGEAGFEPVPPEAVHICDLADWTPAEPAFPGARVCVDPVRGRFFFPAAETGRRVRIDASYGMSMDLGGGPYPRAESLLDSGDHFGDIALPDAAAPAWNAIVAEDCEPRFDPEEKMHYFSSLSAALQEWNSGRLLPIPPAGPAPALPRSGVIRICDSGTYEAGETGRRVIVNGRWLAIQAAEGCSPALRGGLKILGSPAARVTEVAAPDLPLRQSLLVLGGLWIEGGIRILGEASLLLEHCTVAPPLPGRTESAVSFERPEATERSVVKARRCILGGLDLGARHVALDLAACIVDGGDAAAIDGAGAAARLDRCTLFGEARLSRLLIATGVLFTERVRVAVPSEGAVRFSSMPPGSKTPPRERCAGPGSAVLFTSRSYGNPAYAQLSPEASPEIRHGGEDGNEMGVFNSLRQSDRLANLTPVLEELLPWGMTARLSFAT